LQKVRFWDPEHWRFRAEEARTVADQMPHEESRAIMRRIALDYDRLAKVAEEQLADQERGAIGTKNLERPSSGSQSALQSIARSCAAMIASPARLQVLAASYLPVSAPNPPPLPPSPR